MINIMEEEQFGTYIDPLTDFGFKRLFGQEESKEFLISFLNSLLSRYGVAEISSLEYKNNELLGTTELDRKVVYDIHCTTTQGTNFVVELQKGHQIYYKNRSLCYGCRAVTDQMKKGPDYKFELNKVFVVSILNFSMPENKHKPANQYLHSVSLRDDDQNHDISFDNLKFVFIELPKFKKVITKDTEIMDKWLYLFKDLAHFNDLSEGNSEYIEEFWTRFFHRAKIKNLETVELEYYQKSVKYLNQIKDVKDAAYGLLEKEKIEIEEKLLRTEQRKEEAKQKSKLKDIKLAKMMLEFGKGVVDIMIETELSEFEIIALKNKS